MQIRLCVPRKVEVDDHVHCLDVDPSREQVCYGQTFTKINLQVLSGSV